MRKTQRRKTETVNLCEDLVGLSKPEKVTVGERTITLHGVRFLGLESKNGRRYSAAAVKAAIPLYESCKLNADHPDKPRDRRSAHDRLGRPTNLHQGSDGGLYGDAILLRSHPLATRVAEAVQEGMENAFAFSHNADGEARTNGQGILEVEEITEVRSIDLVADGATNQSLFESRDAKMSKSKKTPTVTLRELIEASECADSTKEKLMEMDDATLGAELPAEPEGDWKQDLVSAIGKLVGSEDEGDHAMAKKIMAMLQPAKAPTEEGDGDETEKKDDQDEKKEKTEGQKAKEAKAGAVAITEAKAKDLCDLAGVKPTKDLLECLCDLSEDKAVKHLKLFKGQSAAGKSNAPRSSSPGTFTEGDDRPARKVKDAKSFVEAITSPDDE